MKKKGFFYKTTVRNIILSPNRRGGEHIVFGSDPAGTGVTVSCVHDNIIMSQLVKFNQIWMDIKLGHDEELIRFL